MQLSPALRSVPVRDIAAGAALASLIVAIYCAERLDAAARQVAQLRGDITPDELAAVKPDDFLVAWAVVALVSAVLGGCVAHWVASSAGGSRKRRRWARGAAYGAVACWVLWQLTGMAAFEGWWLERPRLVAAILYWGASAAAAVALAIGGGKVIGSVPLHAASFVRMQALFLFALFWIVFRAPVTSAQLTDVLRAWAEAPHSRALAGIASVLLLGAVIRSSARRLMVPRDAEAPGRGRAAVERAVGSVLRRVFRRWWGWLVAGLLLLASLLLPAFGAVAFALAAVGFVVLLTEPRTPTSPATEPGRAPYHRFAGTLGTAPVAILLVGLVSASTDSLLLGSPSETDGRLLAWTGLVFLLFAVLAGTAHLALWERETAPKRPGGQTKRRQPEPKRAPEMAGLAALGAALLSLADATISACLLLALALLLAFRVLGRRGRPELWAAWGAVLGMGAATYVEPIEVPMAMGAFAVAMVGFAGVMATLHGLAYFAQRRKFTVRGYTGTAPVVLLLLLWCSVAAYKAPGDAHRARTLALSGGPPTATIEDAVRTYLSGAEAVGDPPYVPMLIVGASGGGTKAAYWTDLVLDCAFGAGEPRSTAADECEGSGSAPARRGRLFLTSSVSGGSIGVHHLRARWKDAGGDAPWVPETAGREVLSPLVAWGMFHDLPAFALGVPADPSDCDALPCRIDADRALVQEAAIAGGVLPDGLYGATAPVPIFNGTVGMLGWRRVLLSPLALGRPSGCTEGGPVVGAIDGHDLLGQQDLPRATAALLSARFPVLLPPARLGSSERAVGCAAPTHPDVRIRDGGLIENTGLMTIVDLLPSIFAEIERWQSIDKRAVVRPIVVSVDDDVRHVSQDNEYARSLIGQIGLEDSRRNTDRSRQTLRKLCEQREFAYFEIRPEPHVGAQAATGWEMSTTARRRDLVASLRRNPAKADIARLQRMLDGSEPPGRC